MPGFTLMNHSLPEYTLPPFLNRGRGIYFRGRAMPIRGGLAPDRGYIHPESMRGLRRGFRGAERFAGRMRGMGSGY